MQPVSSAFVSRSNSFLYKLVDYTLEATVNKYMRQEIHDLREEERWLFPFLFETANTIIYVKHATMVAIFEKLFRAAVWGKRKRFIPKEWAQERFIKNQSFKYILKFFQSRLLTNCAVKGLYVTE